MDCHISKLFMFAAFYSTHLLHIGVVVKDNQLAKQFPFDRECVKKADESKSKLSCKNHIHSYR